MLRSKKEEEEEEKRDSRERERGIRNLRSLRFDFWSKRAFFESEKIGAKEASSKEAQSSFGGAKKGEQLLIRAEPAADYSSCLDLNLLHSPSEPKEKESTRVGPTDKF